MAVTRYRKHDIKGFYAGDSGEKGSSCMLSMMVKAGDRIYLNGQNGFDMDGVFHGEDDPGAQAEQACQNIKYLLEEAGASLNDICKMRVYVTDRDYRLAVYSAIARNFKGIYPCSTGLVIKALPLSKMKMQLDVEIHVSNHN